MCLLIALGWLVAAVIWWQFGWAWGVVAVVLFAVTGFGWKLLEVGAAGLWWTISPSRRRFSKAWREIDGDSALGEGAFADYFIEWGTTYRPMGTSAAEYLSPWVNATKADSREFSEAWASLQADRRFGPGHYHHMLYCWLAARDRQRGRGDTTDSAVGFLLSFPEYMQEPPEQVAGE